MSNELPVYSKDDDVKLPPIVISGRGSDPKSRTEQVKPSLTFPADSKKHVSMQPVIEMSRVRMDVLRANNNSGLKRADSTVSRSSEPSIVSASAISHGSKKSSSTRLVSYSQLSQKMSEKMNTG